MTFRVQDSEDSFVADGWMCCCGCLDSLCLVESHASSIHIKCVCANKRKNLQVSTGKVMETLVLDSGVYDLTRRHLHRKLDVIKLTSVKRVTRVNGR